MRFLELPCRSLSAWAPSGISRFMVHHRTRFGGSLYLMSNDICWRHLGSYCDWYLPLGSHSWVVWRGPFYSGDWLTGEFMLNVSCFISRVAVTPCIYISPCSKLQLIESINLTKNYSVIVSTLTWLYAKSNSQHDGLENMNARPF